MRFEPRKRPFLIGPHQPAVSGHICGENGGQPAFDAFRGQSGAPKPHGPNGLSALGAHSNGKREGWHSLSVERPISDRLDRCGGPRLFELEWRPGSLRLSNPRKTAFVGGSYFRAVKTLK